MAKSTSVDIAASGTTTSAGGRIEAASLDKMTPSTLDLLVLTFNCAKSLVNPTVFANHIQTAFANNAVGLPDVVVL